MNKKAHLEPGLFDIILYGRNRKPTVHLKYIKEGYYEIIVLTEYYRISQDTSTNTLHFVDPDEGPMIAPGHILSNEYYDEEKGWMPEYPTYYEVKELSIKINQNPVFARVFMTVTLEEVDELQLFNDFIKK
jgi:hypothetical protein